MRVVLSGGGTGGHIYPAAAIGRQLQREDPGTELLYIGSANGLESRIVPKLGIPFETIEISGFKRKLSLDNVRTVVRFLRAVRRSKALLREFRPDVVVGTGGYVCGPVVYAAARLGIPTLIHEQNVEPGMANVFLSRYADAIAVSFPESESRFRRGRRIIHTGNPCATNVLHADKSRGYASLGIPAGSRIVLVVGGSRGARALNEAIPDIAAAIGRMDHVWLVAVTGEVHYEQTKERLDRLPADLTRRLLVVPYLDNMAEVLAAASLVISRSGASMLAEITALGVPSILVPSPNVTHNHQEANARSLADAGAAVMIVERELTGGRLAEAIARIMGDEGVRQAMSNAAKALAMPDSAARITAEIRTLAARARGKR
jgi:UDP-N-acetylglucosamine--N-acetylmuramyl-(pentapeptide) pyrophosphoryl-undecaprenol N-acetylglucosamine transferase